MDTTILAVLIGVLFTSIATWLNNWNTRSLQLKQWKREDERLHKEAHQRDEQLATEQQRQQKQQIIDNYAQALGCLAILAELDVPTLVDRRSGGRPGETYLNKLQEVQSYLLRIVLDYPDKKDEDYIAFRSTVDTLVAGSTRLNMTAGDLYGYIITMAQKDWRLLSK